MPITCDIGCHPATIGESHRSKAVGQICDRVESALHKERKSEGLGKLVGFWVVVEDTSFVLIDDVDAISGRLEAFGREEDALIDAKYRVK